MQVILLKELHGRGGEGDVINVARGFANNYLFRQGFAVKATKGNLKQLEQRRANIEKREVDRVNNANELANKLNDLKVHVKAQVGEEGILFGSVTAAMIATAIKEEHNIDVDRRRVELGKPIKTVGEFKVDVNVYREITGTVTVIVGDENVPVQADEKKESDANEEAVAKTANAENLEGEEQSGDINQNVATDVAEPTKPLES